VPCPPRKHFLGDDVGLFSDAAREELRVLEDGRADFVKVVTREDVAHLGLHAIPQVGIGREQVTSSADGLNHRNQLPVASSQLSVVSCQLSVSKSRDRVYSFIKDEQRNFLERFPNWNADPLR
jgi:hypothetical protein